MDKPPVSDGSRELQCIGKMEVVRPKPVGFLCGSIHVPTENSLLAFNSALLPPHQTVSAPRYRELPRETDLNMPPAVQNFPEKVLPMSSVQCSTAGDLPWEGGAITSNLKKKCEALAVSGLVEYGDEIDVIAAADIMKQIFKIPYSKARLSIAVHRIGQTLVLNTGPDVEEGEKLVRRHSNQSKCTDQSLFLNFAMHSVRMEACDCPPTHPASMPSNEQAESSVLPGFETSQFKRQHDDVARNERFNSSDFTQVKQDSFLWENKKTKRNRGHDPLKKATQVGEKPRRSVQESEKQRRMGNEGFQRLLFWQFHNFRMLLGSDLLLFSNERYAAVSLHLWDNARKLNSLTWLETWLDNVMASVPELAICYHENGVVDRYELLKTDDICLLKGISEDGTPAFHPHVVQQNGLSVLRFLQENCKQDPGAYWLYKSAGEDVIQLFDLSVIPKNHSSNDCDDISSPLPSMLHRGRSDSFLSLGTLLYRIGHRLSLSMAPNDRAKCARFIKKCLDFLDEPDHLVVRAFAHEQFARLILNDDEDVDLTSESLPVACEVIVTDAEEESLDFLSSITKSASGIYEKSSSEIAGGVSGEDGSHIQDLVSETSVKMNLEMDLPSTRKLIASDTVGTRCPGALPNSSNDENFAVSKLSPTSAHVVRTVADPISAKLAAIHHVSSAIKSLRWMRQLQSTEPELVDQKDKSSDRSPLSTNFSVCACGDTDCIEVCDIREWLPTSKLDHKLWKLVLLLGESYLALGQSYKEDGQLHQALKVVELACSVYGSMPQHLEDTRFISSMTSYPTPHKSFGERNDQSRPCIGSNEMNCNPSDGHFTLEQFSSTYLFWAKAWTLVGDVYVEFHVIKGKEVSVQAEGKPCSRELRMSSEVVKEVQRLKKKLGRYKQNCSSCSLVNCSCQSDRASSGSSASSSSSGTRSVAFGRKHGKKANARKAPYPCSGSPEDDIAHHKVENRKRSDGGLLQHNINSKNMHEPLNVNADEVGADPFSTIDSERVEDITERHTLGSKFTSQTEIASKETPKAKNGGIFKYLGGPLAGDPEHSLLAALSCFGEASKALGGLPAGSTELLAVVKKKGWVCNELGRNRLANKEINRAELAFTDAISAFREVCDYTNIILIYCNLGHGKRALAEEMVSKIQDLKMFPNFRNAYDHALKIAKLEYSESLRYYGAAKAELNAIVDDTSSMSNNLRNEVYTQFAHTYLRLGMLLAREDVIAEVYENGVFEETSTGYGCPSDKKALKDLRKHEISANDAIREALSVYESLGELRKQEAAYAYFQLACYQRDCCLKFLESDSNNTNLSKVENGTVQRVKQYASLADRNWQKAMDFYGPNTHPGMYLTILIERSDLSLNLSNPLHSNAMLESALSRLLEGRRVPDKITDSWIIDNVDVRTRFWGQLQVVLKKMLGVALSASMNKSSAASQGMPTTCNNRFGDIGKLKELYKTALLKTTDFSHLHAMHTLWTS